MPDQPTAPADLEIALQRWDQDHYRVDLRFTQPDSDADIRPAQAGRPPSLAHFDFDALGALGLDPAEYGKALASSLFADETLRTAFAEARTCSRTGGFPLRVRLLIDPTAVELHSLYWETLCDPQEGGPLSTGERILFTRYLSSQDWRRIKPRPRSELRALVCIANPSNLSEYRLAPVDVDGEMQRVQAALGNIPITALTGPGTATLNGLVEKLRDNYDVLYLVCHGALIDGNPRLWMEDAAGKVQVVDGQDLVARMNELQELPRLVVLASCASAATEPSSGPARGLVSLGPLLASAGVSAVVAMHGDISMQTVATFVPRFFLELQRDGQIDRAVAVARGAVRERPDAWMPVLFMRLKSGRLWYVPGFSGDRTGFEKWPTLLDAIRGDPIDPTLGSRCVPIVGAGLSESILGARREIATRWAEQYHFPLAASKREDLPGVAQYLAINYDRSFLRGLLGKYLREVLLHGYAGTLPADAKTQSLFQLMAEAGAAQRTRLTAEPHRVLASLPLDIYITTNADNLLPEALRAAGKDPQVELCRWNEKIKRKSIYEQNPAYRPTVQQPLVYCLFGQIDDPDSMVLTEDDYFDYLIGITSNKDLIPKIVRSALADRALLFLGFQMDDWNFRVPFRYIMRQEGGSLLEDISHVAAQIDPEEGRTLEPERARRYFESYFSRAHISIYWGTVEDFVADLEKQWAKGQ